jgi:capsular polysaccharide transport system ATP-binding protein
VTLELRNIEVRVRKKLQPLTFRNISLRIQPKDRVALLCPDPAGVSGLLAVISGAKAPDAGTVIRNSSVSWPIPNSSFFHKHQTFVANARFMARLYEMDHEPFIARVVEMAAIEDLAEHRMDRCPKDAVSRFSFALGVCLPFDFYLFTNPSAGGKTDRAKYAEVVSELGRKAGLILASSAGRAAQAHCDSAFVIDGKAAVHYDDIDAAIEHLESLKPRASEGADDEDALSAAEEESTFGDF